MNFAPSQSSTMRLVYNLLVKCFSTYPSECYPTRVARRSLKCRQPPPPLSPHVAATAADRSDRVPQMWRRRLKNLHFPLHAHSLDNQLWADYASIVRGGMCRGRVEEFSRSFLGGKMSWGPVLLPKMWSQDLFGNLLVFH